ncbi:MAG: chorismate-binding protein [Propionibacteriaceae bacterium]|jgi:anthranilate synthase component 1|nr:chorismate-binding protein [Propionibacteriaceae bacterium]
MVATAGIETIRVLAAGYSQVPVWRVLDEDTRDPSEVFCVLKARSPQAYILESLLDDKNGRGRYTFLGYDPKAEVVVMDGQLRFRWFSGDKAPSPVAVASTPADYLTKLIAAYRAPVIPELPPFTGGLVGYFAYDYFKYAEPTLKLDAVDLDGFRDADFLLFDKVIAYDHDEHKLYLIVNADTAALEENYRQAVNELDALEEMLRTGEPLDMPALHLTSPWQQLFDEQHFAQLVERAKRYIFEGDIFQVVLSNRLDAAATGSLFGSYQRLREINPSPYMFYFASDDIEIAGASPETLVRSRGGYVATFPLAGTRPSGETLADNDRLAAELLADPKERAEHNMLVDLARNDIGKIAEFGSVAVTDYLSVLRYSHVMHLGSTVVGKLRSAVSPLDVIGAILPAGTLSGAPKIRAAAIINELEGIKRGVYGGAFGYLGFNGELDTCIAIRITYKKNGRVFVRSGAGIVADSVPESEYAECRNKAAAVIQAVAGAAA